MLDNFHSLHSDKSMLIILIIGRRCCSGSSYGTYVVTYPAREWEEDDDAKMMMPLTLHDTSISVPPRRHIIHFVYYGKGYFVVPGTINGIVWYGTIPESGPV